MTSKVYKSAQGKSVNLGSLILQNENVRAVGNMNVNARGDVLDANNKVIDQKNLQTQRQYSRQTNVDNSPVVTSTGAARQQNKKQAEVQPTVLEDLADAPAKTKTLTGLEAAVARAQSTKKATE